jgi:hypothetical protein
MAELPRRMTPSEISRESRWELSAIFNREKDRLNRWIEDEAVERLARDGRNAREAVDAVVQNVKLAFVDADTHRDARIIVNASVGELEREAGSLTWLRTVTVFLLLTLTCEVGFFVVMFFMGLGNLFVVLQGILLAAGSFAVGSGLHGLLASREDRVLGFDRLRGKKSTGLILLLGGAIMIGLVTWLRWSDDPDALAILAFTLALAAAVIVLTAYHKRLDEEYQAALQKMALAQRWWASEKHREACDEGYWKKEYLLRVSRLQEEAGEALKKGGLEDRNE